VDQEVKTNRTTLNNKLSTIIRDFEKEKKKFITRKDNFRRWTCGQKQAENYYNTEP